MNKRIRHSASYRCALIVSTCVIGACIWETENRAKLDLGVEPIPNPFADSAAYRDSIGAFTHYEGLSPMRVRGYGLVVGLGKNGSRDCPRHVFDRLVQGLHKEHRFSSTRVGVANISPEELIRDMDTAVVVVRGEIPPAAVKGSRFDVAVTALPGTQTRTLRGGRLYSTDLKVFRPLSLDVSITGRTLARGQGPLFLNPFSQGDAATQSNPLEGIVLGGGVVLTDRRIRLVLQDPSYQRARQTQDRINAHFPSTRRIADAVSPSFVQLQVPREFQDHPGRFLTLVRALFLSRDPDFSAQRARQLAKEIVRPSAPHAQIALAFEGLGRTALPILNDLYTHPKAYVNFHAALAGMRLGDHFAGDVMVIHADNAASDYRLGAIRALAEVKGMANAVITLRRLLHDQDPRIQIAAYEALAQRGDSSIESIRLGGDNFILDQIPSAGSRLVYAKRSGVRRIALFGQDLRCVPPLLYRAADGSVTISARPDDEHLTVLRTVVASGSTSPPVPATFELAELIRLLGQKADVDHTGRILGLGLDYGAVVSALYNLCSDNSTNAKFLLEEPNVTELLGPRRSKSRPESEM